MNPDHNTAQPQPQPKPAKTLDAAIQARLDAYNALSIGEALNLAQSRRGESKREIARLKALLEQPGVTKKSTIAEARAKR